MRIFVTGGTGLLGNNILRQLNDAGHECMALVRSTPDTRVFDGVDAEFVSGDLRNEHTINEAIKRSDAVIHSAGLIHLGWKQMDESMAVNRDGTRLIVEACLRHDRKLVHVGTVNTIAIASRKTVSDETTPIHFAGGQIRCSYVLSKRAGVEEVKSAVKAGLRANVVHPAFMLGPYDWKPSSGRMVLEVGKTWRPVCPRGSNSVCDVRDVAAATIQAVSAEIENGREYILAGHNLRYKELWSEIAKRTGVRGPLFRAGPLQLWIAGKLGDFKAKVTGNESELNSAAIAMANQTHAYNSSRAMAELGYHIRPLDEIFDDAVDWLKRHHEF